MRIGNCKSGETVGGGKIWQLGRYSDLLLGGPVSIKHDFNGGPTHNLGNSVSPGYHLPVCIKHVQKEDKIMLKEYVYLFPSPHTS